MGDVLDLGEVGLILILMFPLNEARNVTAMWAVRDHVMY